MDGNEGAGGMILHETLIVLVGEIICSALMLGVFALIGRPKEKS